MSYFNKPKLYNTGFLLNDKVSRFKQGLMPQDLSNNCFVGINETNLLKNPYYNNKMFPIRGLYANYEGPNIPDNATCLRNIQSP